MPPGRLSAIVIFFSIGVTIAAPVTRADEPGAGDKKSAKSPNVGKKSKKNSKADADSKPGDRSGRAVRERTAKRGKVPRHLAVSGLKKVIDDATFDAMSFEDFAEWIGRTTGANVVVRWTMLEPLEILPTTPITFSAKKIKLRELLARVFDHLAESRPGLELAAKADGNVLTISSRKDLNSTRLTRSYDVQDLLVSAPNFTGLGIDELGLGGADSFRVSGASADEAATQRPDPAVRKLIEVIQKHIEPRSWKIAGGKGAIRFHRGRLVIYNSLEVHQRIAGALAASKS